MAIVWKAFKIISDNFRRRVPITTMFISHRLIIHPHNTPPHSDIVSRANLLDILSHILQTWGRMDKLGATVMKHRNAFQ
jgi:hypothetical protein